MLKLKLIVILLIIGLPINSFSQLGITHEVGIIVGGAQFSSDYGQRYDMESKTKNMGFSIAFVDYLNLSYTDFANNYIKEHFKVRNEISYNSTELQHYGQWVEKNSITSQQLKAMRGSTKLINLGFQVEYHFLHIHDFERTPHSFSPYIAIGPQISFYNATATSELGELGNITTTPIKYLVPSDGHPHGYSNESKTVFSGVLNIGTRYKLTPMSDLIFDLRAQYFASDWVDGLNPNKDIYTENKSNDWQTLMGIGYIFYLE